MNSQKNILIAFLLNLFFALFELIGGFFTNSVAILSDAIHDLGDALSIGCSFMLEKKSMNKPDDIFTYGYRRYSVIGALITTVILLVGSILVVIQAIQRFWNPVIIDYHGMIIIAIFGFLINFIAAMCTKDGESLNQKAVNIHMLEDVLGWGVVLIGAVVMKFTDIFYIDSIMSIGVAIFIFYHAYANFKEIMNLFLEKIPEEIDINTIKNAIMKVNNVKDVHHIHVWGLDDVNIMATMHVISDGNNRLVKKNIREVLREFNISHVTIEIDELDDNCLEFDCRIENEKKHHHH